MIIPSRWMFGGKGLSEFRHQMINDKKIVELHHFPNSNNCFPNLEIMGGICYFLWNYKTEQKCKIIIHDNNGLKFSESRYLKSDANDDILIVDQRQLNIKNKINPTLEQSFQNIVSNRNPYGLYSDMFKNFEKYNLPPIFNHEIKDGIKIIGLDENSKRVYKYVNQNFPIVNRGGWKNIKFLLLKLMVVLQSVKVKKHLYYLNHFWVILTRFVQKLF